MNFAAILAGGSGARMGNMDKPKQYLDLCGKPIIAYTVEKFMLMPEFEKVIVLCPKSWLQQTRDILEKEFGENEKLAVISGGADRNDTIMNAIAYIEKNYEINNDTVICTHDSVRPFVTYRVIKENLDAMAEYDACDTVIPASDTIVISEDGNVIDEIPQRSKMYQGQTPQTFKVAKLKALWESLNEDEKQMLTDACKISILRDMPCALVKGETFNIKITYPSDLKMAKALLGMEG